jgi:hypothetical protein
LSTDGFMVAIKTTDSILAGWAPLAGRIDDASSWRLSQGLHESVDSPRTIFSPVVAVGGEAVGLALRGGKHLGEVGEGRFLQHVGVVGVVGKAIHVVGHGAGRVVDHADLRRPHVVGEVAIGSRGPCDDQEHQLGGEGDEELDDVHDFLPPPLGEHKGGDQNHDWSRQKPGSVEHEERRVEKVLLRVVFESEEDGIDEPDPADSADTEQTKAGRTLV